jgi:hypothetical protein
LNELGVRLTQLADILEAIVEVLGVRKIAAVFNRCPHLFVGVAVLAAGTRVLLSALPLHGLLLINRSAQVLDRVLDSSVQLPVAILAALHRFRLVDLLELVGYDGRVPHSVSERINCGFAFGLVQERVQRPQLRHLMLSRHGRAKTLLASYLVGQVLLDFHQVVELVHLFLVQLALV